MWFYLKNFRKTKLAISGKEFIHYILIGFLYTALVYTFLLSVLKTTIANASFLQQLTPVWTFMFAHSLLREKATKIQWGSLVASMIGVVIIFSETVFHFSESVWGNILGVISGLSFGFFNIMVRHAGKIHKSDAYVRTFWSFVFGTIFMFPFCIDNVSTWTSIPLWTGWFLLLC